MIKPGINNVLEKTAFVAPRDIRESFCPKHHGSFFATCSILLPKFCFKATQEESCLYLVHVCIFVAFPELSVGSSNFRRLILGTAQGISYFLVQDTETTGAMLSSFESAALNTVNGRIQSKDTPFLESVGVSLFLITKMELSSSFHCGGNWRALYVPVLPAHFSKPLRSC